MTRRHAPAWFVRWYMGRIAGRYCPCEWPIKSKPLIRICAWIDDEYARLDLIRCAAFYVDQDTTTSSTSITARAKWRRVL